MKRSRKRKKFGPKPTKGCRNGHNVNSHGRYKGGGCKKCKKIYYPKYYKTHKKQYQIAVKKWKKKNKKKWLEYQKIYNKGYSKKYRRKHKKRMQLQIRKWVKKHKNYIKKKKKQHYQKNKKLYKDLALQFRYGITLDDYNKMFELQNGKCAICRKSQSEFNRAFAVDEVPKFKNTQNPVVRQLLCHNCNLCLGYAEDNIKILKLAIVYLRKHRNKRRKKNVKTRSLSTKRKTRHTR